MAGGGHPGPHISANSANIQRPPFGSPQNPLTGPFQAAFPRQMGDGGPPNPYMWANGANIQQLNPHTTRWLWEQQQWMASQTQAGNSGGNYPQTAYPSSLAMSSESSRNAGGSDPIDTRMANLSVNDSRHQVPTHISPPTSFSSDPQIGLNQMGSNPSTSSLSLHNNAAQQGSHSNSSSPVARALHLNERDTANSHSPPTTNPPHGIDPDRPPPSASSPPSNFPPSSSSGPGFNAYYGQDSFNGKSFVDPRGKRSGSMLHSIICLS